MFGWFAGVVCDRMPPHRVIHAAQALFLAGLACLWWAQSGASTETRVAWVLIGAFLGGLAWSFVGPARLTTLAQMARPDELRPATIIFNLQVLVGFGLAPLLIGVVRSRSGWGTVIALAATGFVLASILIANLRTHANATPSGNSVLADIGEGFRVVVYIGFAGFHHVPLNYLYPRGRRMARKFWRVSDLAFLALTPPTAR